MSKDKSNGIVALAGAMRQVPLGKLYRHHRGDLYRVLSLSRQQANPNLIEVAYYEHIPLQTPLFPLSLDDLATINPWHQQPHEFSEVVPDPEMGDLVQRYYPLTFQPETGWGFQINKFVSEPSSLDDSIKKLEKALDELEKLPEGYNTPKVEQAKAVYADPKRMQEIYIEALQNGVVELAPHLYVGRHEALGRRFTP